MENKFQYYQFNYGDKVVNSGSKMIFRGEYFDTHGERYYKSYWPCEFRYVEGDKYYIEVDGHLYYCKDLKRKIERFIVLNGKKIPDPTTEDDVKIATIVLVVVMAASTIFHGNFLLWIIELIVYFTYINKLKYGEGK